MDQPGWMDAMPGLERDEGFFRYLRHCPVISLLAFQILHEGKQSGFFALTTQGDQSRVAGVFLEKPDSESWRVALCLAQDAALRYTNTSELVARAASDSAAAGAAQAGMRTRFQAPVFLFRKRDAGKDLPLDFQMWDNDSVFLGGRRPEFLT
jgi:hypothetical protein